MTDSQRRAIAFVQDHYHQCHAMDDGTVRIGIASSHAIEGETTELFYCEPTRKAVRDVLGY